MADDRTRWMIQCNPPTKTRSMRSLVGSLCGRRCRLLPRTVGNLDRVGTPPGKNQDGRIHHVRNVARAGVVHSESEPVRVCDPERDPSVIAWSIVGTCMYVNLHRKD